MKPRTILDTAEPLTQAERVDALLRGMEAQRRELIAAVVDAAAADENFRRDLLDKLQALGTGRRGGIAPHAAGPLIRALRAAKYTPAEIVEQLQRQFGIGARQAWRWIKRG